MMRETDELSRRTSRILAPSVPVAPVKTCFWSELFPKSLMKSYDDFTSLIRWPEMLSVAFSRETRILLDKVYHILSIKVLYPSFAIMEIDEELGKSEELASLLILMNELTCLYFRNRTQHSKEVPFLVSSSENISLYTHVF